MTHRNLLSRSAAEIHKGDQKVMVVGEKQVVRLLGLPDLLDRLADGFRDLATGKVQTPDRPEITVPGKGFMLSMPAWRDGSPMMVKVVCVFEGNLEIGLPNHLAMINLYDQNTGAPLCVMDGTYITGIRTAAAAVLSVQELARKDAKTVTVVGAGVQAREHLRLLPLVEGVERVFLSSLYHEDAVTLAAGFDGVHAVSNLREAIEQSDVVCLATHSYEPVIEAGWVKAGAHISSVGYAPPLGELPVDLVKNGKLYVEDLCAFDPPPVGCGELQSMEPHAAICLGDALIGKAPLRENQEEITVYKAMGISMEDLVAAEIVYRNAMADASMPSVIF